MKIYKQAMGLGMCLDETHKEGEDREEEEAKQKNGFRNSHPALPPGLLRFINLATELAVRFLHW